jgi:hypothetical protein
MELLLDITENIKKEKKPQLIQLLPFSLGPEDFYIGNNQILLISIIKKKFNFSFSQKNFNYHFLFIFLITFLSIKIIL